MDGLFFNNGRRVEFWTTLRGLAMALYKPTVTQRITALFEFCDVRQLFITTDFDVCEWVLHHEFIARDDTASRAVGAEVDQVGFQTRDLCCADFERKNIGLCQIKAFCAALRCLACSFAI